VIVYKPSAANEANLLADCLFRCPLAMNVLSTLRIVEIDLYCLKTFLDNLLCRQASGGPSIQEGDAKWKTLTLPRAQSDQ
jgi:hypothetical protein